MSILKKQKKYSQNYWLAVSIVFMIAILGWMGQFNLWPTGAGSVVLSSSHQQVQEFDSFASQEIFFEENHYLEHELTARAFAVYDLSLNKYLLEKNLEERLPIASLTKLITALVATDRLSPERVVVVPGNFRTNFPSPSLNLRPGMQIKVQELLHAILISSANDAAELLVQTIGGGDYDKGLVILNNHVFGLGLKNTHLADGSGLNSWQAHSTIEDLLVLSKEISRHPGLQNILGLNGYSVKYINPPQQRWLQTTNYLRRIHPEIIIAGKTGYTEEARGNLWILFEGPYRNQMVAVVIGSENREDEILRLIEWVYNEY